jgi:hypothetical protein
MLKNTQNRSLSQENSPDVIVLDSDSCMQVILIDF